METIKEYQSYETRIKQYNTLTLKSKLYLSKQIKNQKQYFLQMDSLHKTYTNKINKANKTNDTCEITGASNVNSISNTGLSIPTSPTKKFKGRVNFAPRYKLVNYIYYDPRETVCKEVKKEEIKEESNKSIKIDDNVKKKEEEDKNICLCSCLIM